MFADFNVQKHAHISAGAILIIYTHLRQRLRSHLQQKWQNQSLGFSSFYPSIDTTYIHSNNFRRAQVTNQRLNAFGTVWKNWNVHHLIQLNSIIFKREVKIQIIFKNDVLALILRPPKWRAIRVGSENVLTEKFFWGI